MGALEFITGEDINKYEGYIYCIYNKVNLCSYIGQTTRTIETRFNTHKTKSKNINRSIYLYSDVAIFGWDIFDIFEIEKIESDTLSELKILLNEKEMFYIAKYNTLYPNGYNISKGGWMLPNTFDTCRVYKFDLDGNLLQEYQSMTDAAENNHLSQADISNCCNNKKVATVGGFYWSKSKIFKKPKITTHKKRIIMMDLNDNVLKEFDSITDAAIVMFGDKKKHSAISKCLTGKSKTALGYVWQYK